MLNTGWFVKVREPASKLFTTVTFYGPFENEEDTENSMETIRKISHLFSSPHTVKSKYLLDDGKIYVLEDVYVAKQFEKSS